MNEREGTGGVEDALQELISWFKVVNFSNVKSTLESALDSSEKRATYQMTEIGRSRDEISAMLAKDKLLASPPKPRTISTWQKGWERIGIVRRISDKRRERVFDLQDFGLST